MQGQARSLAGRSLPTSANVTRSGKVRQNPARFPTRSALLFVPSSKSLIFSVQTHSQPPYPGCILQRQWKRSLVTAMGDTPRQV